MKAINISADWPLTPGISVSANQIIGLLSEHPVLNVLSGSGDSKSGELHCNDGNEDIILKWARVTDENSN